MRRLTWFVVLAGSLSGLTPSFALAADTQPFDFRPSSGSVPLWTEAPPADSLDLSQIVRELRGSVFLVGTPDVGKGTAFVISQENRLLATNAHVADIMFESGGEMLAIANGTARTYKVIERYYHPGVRRLVENQAVRTSDPARGEVYPESPDVAVLRVAEGEELPAAISLATPDEIQDLLARPVAMMGFPGHDTRTWPVIGQKAQATFRQGVICRVTDFFNDVDAPDNQLQFLQHSMANWFGFSGSPIFMKNGHVVALNNSGTTKKRGDLITSLAFGVRVDCLWELLKAHSLLSQVAVQADPGSIDVERFSQPDATEQKLNKAKRLVAEAKIAVMRDDFLNAVHKCNEAIDLMPNLTVAYDTRHNAYNLYVNRVVNARNAEAKKYFEWALEDAKTAARLEPTSVDHFLDDSMSTLNVLNVDAPLGSFYEAPKEVQRITKLLETEGIRDRDKSYAYRVRAIAKAWSGDALDDIKSAIKADPFIPQAYRTLATYYQLHGNPEGERDARAVAAKIAEAIADSDQAWLAATSRDENNRNGEDARRLAKKACEATEYKWWGSLRSLAAAYAELGQFDQAAEYARKALDVAPDDEADQIQKQLRFYRHQAAWRED
jgi:tetratricopeptide (TPR) repeat protein